MPPGTRADALPSIPRQRTPGGAQPDPIDELADRLDDFVAAAVHPDEIAALLESDGLSDDQIRERYGVKNSFALAEELYERVPRRYPEPEGPPHDRWRSAGLLGCLLRGIVFALPGLGYVLGAPFLTGPRGDFGLPAGTVPLLAGALCGWTWNQGLAHRAYSWLGLGDRTAARRALLVGAPTGALLGTLVALAVAGTATPAAALFATGQSCYLAAATTLLVLGHERPLLAALTPMTAGAALTLVHPLPEVLRLALLLASLTGVTLLALLKVLPPRSRGPAGGCGPVGADRAVPRAPSGRHPTRHTAAPPSAQPAGSHAAHPAGTRAPRPAGSRAAQPAGSRAAGAARVGAGGTPTAPGRATHPRPTPTPGTPGPALTASLPYALFGLGSGVLVVHAALGDALTGAATTAVAAPAAVALTLSMGPAEYLLHRFRSGSLAGLRSTTTPTAFRRTTARTLITCLTAYLTTLLALTLATTALWPHAPATDPTRLTALLLLGTVMWTGLLLQSFGAITGAATLCVLAALAQTLALATRTGTPPTVGLAVYGTAATAQCVLVCALLGRATAHR
ncbi:hypothetical protein ICC28_00325 [Streptomyces sp. TRM68416]|nr:hypothetical protein [Streptomyces sp. TRM68416]MBD0837160.1 hypothetical protein [Streptomyces sp. TRM68416]